MEMPVVNHQQYLLLLGAAAALNKMKDKIHVPRIDSKDKAKRSGMDKRMSAYAKAALRNLSGQLGKVTAGGRNDMLNRSAFACGQFVGAGLIERTAVESALEEACITNSYIDDDGQRAFDRTMRSGLDAGIKKPVDTTWLIKRLTSS